jgi:serine protease inhibitor
MDLPLAANKIITQLKDLNISTAEIPTKLDEIASAVVQPFHERIEKLEEEIHGNNYRDFIRQEVQNHNDIILDRKIQEISTLFQNELNRLEQRITAVERWHKQSDTSDTPDIPADIENDADDASTDSGNDTNPNSTTKRPPKGRTSS